MRPRTPLGALRRLRKVLPTTFAVRLRWVPKFKEGYLGFCSLVERRGRRPFFLLELSRHRHEGLPGWVACETVAHEYAHAMVWSPGSPALQDHGELWGLAYSKVYRAVLQ